MLDISISGLEVVISYLTAVQQRGNNIRPLLLEIGEDLTESTKQRFVTTTDPDGEQWAENSQVTLDRKSGSKPLTNHGSLADSIHYAMLGDYGVEIGSDKVQANMMQYGGTTAQFSHLWGDIPSRPFIGLSAEDKQSVLELVSHYLL
jgi:phage virion morphogenesis protein